MEQGQVSSWWCDSPPPASATHLLLLWIKSWVCSCSRLPSERTERPFSVKVLSPGLILSQESSQFKLDSAHGTTHLCLSAAVWELPPFMSLSPLWFWIFDCKGMCGDVLSVNSTARMKSNRKTCRAFSCEYQRSTLLVLVFQNFVLYNRIQRSFNKNDV